MTQAALAAACDLNQGHLSRVLARKLKLAAKTEAALRAWLARTAEEVVTADADIRGIVERLASAPSERRMQIMQLLQIVEQLTR
ncbi:MAG: hypothetical protein HQL33_08690 [Alphaproteobacteria bacterium]|nr:hypothetical protein [Alphaproteobacteria bacterium]